MTKQNMNKFNFFIYFHIGIALDLSFFKNFFLSFRYVVDYLYANSLEMLKTSVLSWSSNLVIWLFLKWNSEFDSNWVKKPKGRSSTRNKSNVYCTVCRLVILYNFLAFLFILIHSTLKSRTYKFKIKSIKSHI